LQLDLFRYDIRASLSRLHSVDDMETMKHQARSESLLMSFYKCSLPSPTTVNNITRQADEPSTALLQDYCAWLLKRFLPVSVRGDGNCLFRAISYAMYGNEEQYMHLRLLTVIEVLLYQEFYDISSNMFYAPFAVEIDGALKLPPYGQFIKELASDGSHCDMLAILAVSSVIHKPIQTFWPVTVKLDGPSPFTKLIVGRELLNNKHPLYVLWTACAYMGLGAAVNINHFVPLLEIEQDTNVDSVVVDSDSDDKSHCQSIASQSIAGNDSQHESQHETMSATESDSDDNEHMITDTESSPAISLTSGFLSDNECIRILTSHNSRNIQPQVPCGPKHNVYFMVDNTNNVLRESENKRRVFWDDCGAWGKHTTVNQYYLRESGKEIRFVNGLYCKRRKVENKLVTEPLDVQPSDDDVYTLSRFYGKLKRDNTYQKRCTWLRNGPPVVIVEYLGIFPPNVAKHGNAKGIGPGEYVRTHPNVVENIKKKCALSKEKPRVMFKSLALGALSDHEKPRNLKQVQNESVKQAKSGSSSSNNFADEIQTLSSLVAANHPFVKCVIIDEDSSPSVILFTKEQIDDVRRFCTADANSNIRSVLGVDRTFNLSPLFVTVTVFKNNSVVRANSQQPPVFYWSNTVAWRWKI